MVCSVLRLSADKGTVDLMGALEKEFGKKITTRNWNTVLKIIKSSGEAELTDFFCAQV